MSVDPVPGDSGAAGAIAAAEASLNDGAGPARGTPMVCGIGLERLACSAAPASVTTTSQWRETNVAINSSALPAPSVRDQLEMAYDPVTRAVVLFGGYEPQVAAAGDTWTFSNGSWTDLSTQFSSSPPARWGDSLTWDSADGYVLLFGGRNTTSFFNDTWAFNGSAWARLPTNVSPSPREYMAMADDMLDGYVVATGGGIGNLPVGSGSPWTFFNDTWTFRSGQWTNQTNSSGGTGLVSTVAYDANDREVVALGTPTADGTLACPGPAYTWTFANGTWTNLSASKGMTSPRVLFPAMVYDPYTSSVILFGGKTRDGGGCDAADFTYAFASGHWSNLSANLSAVPGNRDAAASAFDPAFGGIVLFGGTWDSYSLYFNDAWVLTPHPIGVSASATPINGTLPLTVRFSASVTNATSPDSFDWDFADGSPAQTGATANHTFSSVGAYNVSVQVHDAWNNDTFAVVSVSVTSNGSTGGHGGGGSGGAGNATNHTGWLDLSAHLTRAPDIRDMAAMAYDPPLHAVVLFGGYSPLVFPFGDTWLFSNGTWTDVSASLLNSPPARWGDRLVWDAADGSLVLFGGRNLTQFFNDTWTFTGATWNLVPTGPSPSPRAFYEFTYDAADGYVLLYGGGIGNIPAGSDSAWTVFSDTWSYHNGTWTNLSSRVTGAPGPRELAGLAFDHQDGYALLYGGVAQGHPNGPCAPLPYAYTYLNGTWTNISATMHASPGALASAAMVYSSVDRAVFLFGGTTPASGWCASTSGTYEYTNGSWTNLSGSLSPSARDESAAAFDPISNATVLFGGNKEGVTLTSGYYNDTWLYVSAAALNGSGSGGSGNNSGNGRGGGGIPLSVTGAESVDLGPAPLSVEFSAVVGEGTPPYAYAWTFGDGSPSVSGALVQHLYTAPGLFTPEVTVTDSLGANARIPLGSVHVLAGTNSSATGASPPVHGQVPISNAVILLLGGAGAGAIIMAGAVGWRRRRGEEGPEVEDLATSLARPEDADPVADLSAWR